MKSLISKFSVLLIAVFSFTAQRSIGQITVRSINGYNVNISITLQAIVPHTSPCTYGYNYDVRLGYVVTFSGPGAPSTLDVLQGTVGCGPNSLFFDIPNGPSSGTTTTGTNIWRSVADCNTATISSLGCRDVLIEIQGPGINHQTVGLPSSTLPITLVSFDAEATNDAVELNWTTASEKNNDHFTVERSADARTFSRILELPGAGNSSEMLRYTATDKAPLAGTSYYRLRQTDIDGTSTLSSVVAVVEEQDVDNTFSVYPNPTDATTIVLPSNTIGQLLEVHSIAGRLLYSGMLDSEHFDCSSLNAGIYLLIVTDPRSGSSRQCRLVHL